MEFARARRYGYTPFPFSLKTTRTGPTQLAALIRSLGSEVRHGMAYARCIGVGHALGLDLDSGVLV